MNEIALKTEVNDAVSTAKALSIKTVDDCVRADRNCKALLELKKRIQSDFEDSKKKAHEAWKAIVAQEKGHLDGIDEARKIYINNIASFNKEQEKIRQQEEILLQERANKLAEEQQIADAVAAEESGAKETAEAIISAPVNVPVVIVPKSTPKLQTRIRSVPDLDKIQLVIEKTNGQVKILGVRAFQKWDFELTDRQAVPEEYRKVA